MPGQWTEKTSMDARGREWIIKQAPEGRLFVYSSFAALRGVFRDDDISIYEISMEVYSSESSRESPTILR